MGEIVFATIIHYIKPQTLEEIIIKLHLIYQQARPNNNINPYFLNHTQSIGVSSHTSRNRNYTFNEDEIKSV